MKKILLFFIFSISLTSFVLADYKKPVAMESEVFQEVSSPEAELIGNNDKVISETNDISVDFESVEFDIIEEEEKNTSFNIKLSFVGDVMLASYMNKTESGNFNDYANKNKSTYFFEKVYDIFSADDFTIVNLENVFTDNKLKEVEKDHSPAYWYRAQTSNTNIITSSSIEVVSLANNHFGDYGQQGRKDTIAAVENAGLLYGNNDKTVYVEKNGYVVAIICHGLWNEGQANTIINRIKEAEEQSDFQIVFYHGGKERVHIPEEWKVRASRKLVDNGADLVVGNHPHVLQPMENYNGVDIIYSMGNFCFGGNRKPENRTIIYQINLTVNDNNLLNVESDIIPCYVYTGNLNNYQPAPIEDEIEKQKVLDFMSGLTEKPF